MNKIYQISKKLERAQRILIKHQLDVENTKLRIDKYREELRKERIKERELYATQRKLLETAANS